MLIQATNNVKFILSYMHYSFDIHMILPGAGLAFAAFDNSSPVALGKINRRKPS